MTRHNSNIIWIAWEKHRRTIELNKVFLSNLIILESNLPRFIKHPLLSFKSWKIIHIERPKILFVQNPSILLTLIAVLLKPIYKYRLIVDAHNAGLMPTLDFLKPLNFLFTFLQKRSDITIVTNQSLAELVKKNGGRPYVLPDKIPDAPKVQKKKLNAEASVLYICTFSDDEPYTEVINAAALLTDNIKIYITGKHEKKRDLPSQIPSNVVLTGFLPEKEYWSLLSSVNVSMILTKRENCLVCGAYESVAVEKPMILSDTSALRKYFFKGTFFSQNETKSIAQSIKICLAKEKELNLEVSELKRHLNSYWQKNITKILDHIANYLES